MIPALRVLAAATFVAAGLGLGAGTAHAQAPIPATVVPSAAEDGDVAVFTGTFVRRSQDDPGAYQVQVDLYFGPTVITTRRVTVRSSIAIEDCGRRQTQGPTAPASPSGPGGTITPDPDPSGVQTIEPTETATGDALALDDSPRLFKAVVDGDDYRIAACRQVSLVSDAVLIELAEDYGEGHKPTPAEQPAQTPEAVGYRCSDSDTAVDGPDACSALVETRPFDRAAAPGLALVIVGLLGLLVVRRVGRRA